MLPPNSPASKSSTGGLEEKQLLKAKNAKGQGTKSRKVKFNTLATVSLIMTDAGVVCLCASGP